MPRCLTNHSIIQPSTPITNVLFIQLFSYPDSHPLIHLTISLISIHPSVYSRALLHPFTQLTTTPELL